MNESGDEEAPPPSPYKSPQEMVSASQKDVDGQRGITDDSHGESAIQSEERRHLLRIRWLYGLSAVMVTATLACVLYSVALTAEPEFPAEASTGVDLQGRNRVDVLLVDQPAPEVVNALRDIVLPMLAVTRFRMPSTPEHFRIIISRQGFPGAWNVQGASIAGYEPDKDQFVIDAAKVLDSNVNGAGKSLPLAQHLAFLMGHEATHLYQARFGMLKNHASTFGVAEAYNHDPIELEAFAAGVDIASQMADAPPIAFRFTDGRMILPTLNGNYSRFQEHDLHSDTDIHVTRTWSLYGTGLRLIDWAHTPLRHRSIQP